MEETILFFTDNKPIFTVMHVLSVIFGMGAALVSDLLFNFYTKDKELSNTELGTLSILSKIVITSLPIIILSGIGIFFSNIEKYIHSAKFLVKMTVLLILLINGFILDKYVWSHLLKKKFFISPREKKFRQISFVCGTISIVSWLFVCTLGVLDSVSISYTILLEIYLVLIAGGIPVALFIENREFEK